MRTLVDLALAPEHRRGHGGLHQGRVDVARLRRALAGVPLPRAADGRPVLGVDVSPWLRPDANTCADRAVCHTFGRGEGKDQLVAGRPYSVVAAVAAGRTSWTAVPDAVRLPPGADAAALTTVQMRGVVERLIDAGQRKPGGPNILVVLAGGYDAPRIVHLLAGLPIEILGRLSSDRVMCRPAPIREESTSSTPPEAARPDTAASSFSAGLTPGAPSRP
ncbi:transposase [Streptomyces sp. IBSNAI002]|uniref:transposase n=1 Tax=Streptomyces sp. IBSNAI002 TaxID=3457500 RepID=UPI003FD64501